MTVASSLLPRRLGRFPAGEEIVEIDVDGESRLRVNANWQPGEAPTVVFFHGLGGCAGAPYVLGGAHKAWKRGFHAIRVNLRNHGGTEHLSPGLTHAGHLEELEAVVRWLQSRPQGREVYLAGFSMGGNMVLKAAAQWGDRPPAGVAGVLAVSPAVDIRATTAALQNHRLNALYDRYFVARIKRMYRRKARLWPDHYPADGVRGVRRLHHFDEAFTAPYFGFGGADELYARSGVAHEAHAIRIPTWILHAEDDPFVPVAPLRRTEFADNPWIDVQVTRYGGHVGWIGRRRRQGGDQDRFWAENRVLERLQLWHLARQNGSASEEGIARTAG